MCYASVEDSRITEVISHADDLRYAKLKSVIPGKPPFKLSSLCSICALCSTIFSLGCILGC